MPLVTRIIASCVSVLLLATLHAGDAPSQEELKPTPLPSLEQRVRNAELIVRLRVETKKGEAVGRIVEVLKGAYDATNYPDDPKGYFAFGIPASQYKMDHDEEVWFLGGAQTLYAPADSQPDPKAFIFRPAKVYDDRLELRVRDGAVAFPTVGQRYHHEVLQTKTYKASEFLAHIRAAVKIPHEP